MKKNVFVLTISLILISILVVIPSSATTFDFHPLYSTAAVQGDNVNKYTNFHVGYGGADICAAYGKTSPFNYIYVGHFYDNMTAAGGWYGSYRESYPFDYNLSVDNAEALTHPRIAVVAQCYPGYDFYTIEWRKYYNSSSYYPQIEVNFTGTPTNGSAPMMVNFAITNFTTGVKPGSSHTWDFGDGSIVMASSETNMHQYQTAGTFSVSLTYSNLSNTSQTITKSQYIRTTNQTGLTLHLETRDVESKALITGATAGIKNITSGSWWNFTTSSGIAYWRSTDPNGTYPLSVGQVVTLGSSAPGYDAKSASVTIPYDGYREQIFLTRNSSAAANGTWNLIVLVKSNKYGTPINSATVNLITGVNEDSKWQDITDDTGTVSFMNITPSTTALVDVIRQGYQYASAVITVVPNSTQRCTIELVKIGETPVATPVTTPNSTPLTGVPTPVITGPNGEPITSPEGKAQWGLDQLFNIIPQVVLIVISIIFAWLFWRAFDISTNGMGPLVIRKVIEGFIRQMFK